jgi:hypothetical protein
MMEAQGLERYVMMLGRVTHCEGSEKLHVNFRRSHCERRSDEITTEGVGLVLGLNTMFSS